MVGPPCFGLVADAFSYPGAWLGGAALMLLAAGCVVTSHRRYERLRPASSPGR
jgi:predicted MFS family arabinose efflux permease